MKLSPLLIAAVFIPSLAFASTFSSTLYVGSRGPEVTSLQKILNADSATRVAASGPGSPGNETDYFGAATKQAVIRLQEKYQKEILMPNGLSAGTGRVGPSTRAVLEAHLSVVSPVPVRAPDAERTPAISSSMNAVVSPTITPNEKRLAGFLAGLDRLAKNKNYSKEQLVNFKKAIIEEAASTTDLREVFLQKLKNRQEANISPIERISLAVREMVIQFLEPSAMAATGAPFGGAVIDAYPCACSDNWLIQVTPLPPTYVEMLSYFEGTQAYLSYNIPATEWLLGEYEPGTGVCLEPGTPCEGGPTEGTISPIVGSSPL